MSKLIKEIIYKNKKYSLDKFYSESNNYFQQRIDFIKKLETKNIEWKEAVRLSKVWSNMKFKNCKYTKSLYLKVTKLDS
jgi:hypothetical protein